MKNKNNINRRQFLSKTALGLGALSLGASAFKCAAKTVARPNIILIMADDMGYSDLGCYGSEIPTPNIDRLANEGIRFTQFYNAARCCPTRASLLTGLYPHQAGVGDMVSPKYNSEAYQGYLNDKCVTIAEVLKDAGYTTHMSGKWHVGENRRHWPTDRGFDKYFGLISGAANYFDISKTKAPNVVRQMAIDDQSWTPPKDGFYMTSAITEQAVNFLDEAGRQDDPFFMYVAYTAPHWPLHALEEDIEKFLGKYEMGWDELRKQRYQRMLDMGIIDESWTLSPRDEEAPAWESVKDKKNMDRRMAIYAAQNYRMDIGVGQIMDKLKELGKTDNTLVLFLSDNGGCHEGGPLGFDNRKNGIAIGGVDSYASYGRSWSNASNTPFRMHKHWTHEGGIATPLIAHWPEVIRQKGKLTDQVGHIVDIMTTCADVAGAKYPSARNGKKITPMQGKSLLPIFNNQKRESHDYIFWEHEGSKAVRHGKWKLVSMPDSTWELYDMEKDRSELNDLSDQFPEMKQQLIGKWEIWADEIGVVRI
jgi:arylsulfatase A-like enzyme